MPFEISVEHQGYSRRLVQIPAQEPGDAEPTIAVRLEPGLSSIEQLRKKLSELPPGLQPRRGSVGSPLAQEHDTAEDDAQPIPPQGSSISGRVVDAAGQPVALAYVHPLALDGAAPTPECASDVGCARTDADGRFLRPGFSAGSYRIFASKAGFATTETNQPVVIADASVPDVELILDAGATVYGKLLGLTFKEHTKAHITAMKQTPLRSYFQAQPDAEGNFRLLFLEPGPWEITAEVPGRKKVQTALTIDPREREVVLELALSDWQERQKEQRP